MVVVSVPLFPLHDGAGGLIPRGSRIEVFREIYWVFLILGVAVGVVVIGYMLYTAYKYRDGAGNGDDVDHPTLGEIPTGGGKGGKLFLSLALSTVVVVSLIAWTYFSLLYVEQGAATAGDDDLTVHVEGYQFGWEFTYPNGNETGTLRLPEDTTVRLEVTSRDVFHNFGIPALKVKSDAIPGQTTETWLTTGDPAEYTASCYELCGVGHSSMEAPVVVMERSAYEKWYANTTNDSATPTETPT